ncbi:MAG: HIT domain-containing protein [Puniceicoccales bacterium]|jgi:histidine triad (HIT) family protein|nr:HIT domain-containing protein [Puniceicoccales bacterium]
METLFEKIAAGQIPAEILHRDDVCFVLRDIAPQAPVHLLVVPLKPIPDLAAAGDGDGALLGHLLATVRKMGQRFVPSGEYRVVINCGAAAGQTVPHLHIHLLAGRDFSWPPG